MNVNMDHAAPFVGVLLMIMGLATTLFWMVVAWRVLRVLERLGGVAERMTDSRYRG